MNLLIRPIMVLLIASCALKPIPEKPKKTVPQKKPVASIESKQLASELESNLVAEIQFQKNRHVIPNDARKKLSELNKKAHSRGKIKQVKVVTWGDREYPSKEKKTLSNSEKTLVKKRNEAVEHFLHQLDKDVEVETFSMAERPSEFEKMISTDEAEIKKHAKETDIATTEHKGKSPRKASKSVVIYIMDET